MGTPVMYNASLESVKVPDTKAVEARTTPKIDSDPLMAFENYHFSVKTDLKGWMTFSLDDRIKKAKQYVECSTKMTETLKIDKARRHKILNYIIWIESHHPNGNRLAAREAFMGLFPKDN